VDYDLVVTGGGLAGSSLGIALAEQGARVLIVEKEGTFKDRVRGEGMLPWGAAEAKTLGIYQPLIDSCGREVQWWTTPQGQPNPRVTSPSGVGCRNFYHPEMQQLLLDLAAKAGCDVRRPAEVTGVVPGLEPAVTIRSSDVDLRVTARLWLVRTGGTHVFKYGLGCPSSAIQTA